MTLIEFQPFAFFILMQGVCRMSNDIHSIRFYNLDYILGFLTNTCHSRIHILLLLSLSMQHWSIFNKLLSIQEVSNSRATESIPSGPRPQNESFDFARVFWYTVNIWIDSYRYDSYRYAILHLHSETANRGRSCKFLWKISQKSLTFSKINRNQQTSLIKKWKNRCFSLNQRLFSLKLTYHL